MQEVTLSPRYDDGGAGIDLSHENHRVGLERGRGGRCRRRTDTRKGGPSQCLSACRLRTPTRSGIDPPDPSPVLARRLRRTLEAPPSSTRSRAAAPHRGVRSRWRGSHRAERALPRQRMEETQPRRRCPPGRPRPCRREPAPATCMPESRSTHRSPSAPTSRDEPRQPEVGQVGVLLAAERLAEGCSPASRLDGRGHARARRASALAIWQTIATARSGSRKTSFCSTSRGSARRSARMAM